MHFIYLIFKTIHTKCANGTQKSDYGLGVPLYLNKPYIAVLIDLDRLKRVAFTVASKRCTAALISSCKCRATETLTIKGR